MSITDTSAQSTRRGFLGALASLPLAAGGVLGPARTMAQDRYPSRTIKLIVPFAPGSSTDIAARSWGEVIGRQLGGASVIVDNRAGAGGNIGATAVARSTPDGYTLLYSTATTWAIAPLIYQDLAYQPTRDFLPVAVTTTVPTLLVVGGDSDIRSFQDLAARVKAAPDRHSYGSNGVGANSHITCKLIANRLGVPNLLHVPFKQGSQGVMAEVAAGRLTFAVDPWSVVGPLVRAGRLRALAATGSKRLSVAPEIPTLSEMLHEELDTTTWSGLWAPAGTPADTVSRLHEAIAAGRKNVVLARQFEEQGTPLMPDMSLQQVNTFMKQEVDRWRVMVKEAQITV
jgi:tripartite-type tricarboxylate transporter receptor subunit TctC